MSATDLAQGVTAAITPALAPLNLLVEDVTVTAAGKRRLVQVLVDSDLSSVSAEDTTSVIEPLSLDEVADASRLIDAALDESDVMGSAAYVLEVSSSGLSRPLTEPRHFRRNVGRLVEFTTGADGATHSVTGRIEEVGDGIRIEVPATKKHPARTEQLAFDDVRKGVVQVEFNRPKADEPETGSVNDVDDPDVDIEATTEDTTEQALQDTEHTEDAGTSAQASREVEEDH